MEDIAYYFPTIPILIALGDKAGLADTYNAELEKESF